MEILLNLFTANILPIFLTAGAGYLVGKYLQVDPRTISRVVFFVFSPCLVFKLIAENQLEDRAFLLMASYAAITVLAIGAITWLLGRLLKLERRVLVAVLLTTMFTNAGNYGLSLNTFAFGEAALAYASLFFVTSAILVYSLGVVVASMGKANLRDGLVSLLKVPNIYALALAFLFNTFDWSLPLSLDRAVSLLSQAAIPTMLILLGLQLQRVQWSGRGLAIGLANGIRLAIAPVVAIGLSLLFGLQGAVRQAGILEASMPTAVIVTVLATEYDVEPALVTTVVTTTTLLSPLTLTPLLAYLGA